MYSSGAGGGPVPSGASFRVEDTLGATFRGSKQRLLKRRSGFI